MTAENQISTENQILGRIYKITSGQTPWVYYGSTTKPLNKRLTGHKTDYKRYLDGKQQKAFVPFIF